MEQHHKDPITKKTVDEDVVGGTNLVEATASHGVSVKTLERALGRQNSLQACFERSAGSTQCGH